MAEGPVDRLVARPVVEWARNTRSPSRRKQTRTIGGLPGRLLLALPGVVRHGVLRCFVSLAGFPRRLTTEELSRLGHHGRVPNPLDPVNDRLQSRADEANRAQTEDPNWEMPNARTPGPAWAHGIGALPIIGLIGVVAIAIDAWRKRRRSA
jgi:hypothetical protein